MLDSIKNRVASALFGASAETLKIAESIASSATLARLWQYLDERLQDMGEAGKLSPCDVGAVAPELQRVLSMLGNVAEKQIGWVSYRFQQNWLARALWHPDPMDLILAMRGLEQAAQVAGGEVWALQRRLRHMQYPGSPLLSAKPQVAALSAAPWMRVTEIPWLPSEQVASLTSANIVEAVVWLDRRVASTTQRNIQRIREGMAIAAGCQLADPLAVSAAVAELDALVGFTIWFSQGIQQIIWQRMTTSNS